MYVNPLALWRFSQCDEKQNKTFLKDLTEKKKVFKIIL